MAGDKPTPKTGWVWAEVRSRAIDWIWRLLSPLFGILGGALAVFQEYDLAMIFAFAAFAFAMTAIGLNQGLAFMRARSIAGKLIAGRAQVHRAEEVGAEKKGYILRVPMMNRAPAIFVEYEVVETRFELDEKVASGADTVSGQVMAPLTNSSHSSGLVNLGWRPNATMTGKMRLHYRYGRAGKLNYSHIVRASIVVKTDQDGKVTHSEAYLDN